MGAETCIRFHILTYTCKEINFKWVLLVHVTHLAAMPFYSGSNLNLFERYEVSHAHCTATYTHMQLPKWNHDTLELHRFLLRFELMHSLRYLLTWYIIILTSFVREDSVYPTKKTHTAQLSSRKWTDFVCRFCSSENIKCYFSRKQWRPFLCLCPMHMFHSSHPHISNPVKKSHIHFESTQPTNLTVSKTPNLFLSKQICMAQENDSEIMKLKRPKKTRKKKQ